MPSFIAQDGPDQQFLLPPDPREWLPADHLSWRVAAVVSEFDLAEFEGAYRGDGRSRPAYHPRSMLSLIMYCYAVGKRSSRSVEKATWDDVGARVIMGNRHPDHATVARFTARHWQRIKQLLVQTLVIAVRDGLVTVDVVAGDGTMVKANASRVRNMTAEQLGLQIDELERVLDAEVDKWRAEAQAADEAEDVLFGVGDNDDDDDAGPSTLSRLKGKITRRRAAAEKLNEREAERGEQVRQQRQEKAARAEERVWKRQAAADMARARQQAKYDAWRAREAAARAAGKAGLPGAKPVPAAEHMLVRHADEATQKARDKHAAAQADVDAPISAPAKPATVNLTDPGSRIMKNKNGGYQQLRNLQITVNPFQLILGVGCHDNPADVGALHPGLRLARANLDAAGITDPIGAAVYDAGYASADNFTTSTPDPDTTLLVAVTNEADQTGRRDPAQPRHHTDSARQTMATKLATNEGKTLYKRRAPMVEPVFSQWFTRFGRELNYRSDKAVDTELTFMASVHNICKIITHRAATATP